MLTEEFVFKYFYEPVAIYIFYPVTFNYLSVYKNIKIVPTSFSGTTLSRYRQTPLSNVCMERRIP